MDVNAGRFLISVMLLLITVAAGSFADGLSAPRVTLSVTDEPLTNVLERIAEQTGVSIVMTNEAAGRESISIRVRNAELENALDQALSGYNYTLSFFADQNVISKVVITVQEKKTGLAGTPASSMRAQAVPHQGSASLNDGNEPLTGRALTLHMAEAERLRGKKYEPVVPRKRPEGSVGMEDVVYRMGNVKTNGGPK